MVLPMVLESAIFAFGIQLILCFKAKKPMWRCMPLILVAAADLFGWLTYLFNDQGGKLVLPYMLAFVGLIWLAGIALAWGTYGIVKAVQKRK